jgi:hypothetical protein
MIARAWPVLIFFAVLLGSGTWLAEIQPLATVPVLREKSAWLAAHADDYDTLFIGTSRIYRGIKPSLFDELTAAAGVATHSFNLGIDAMSPPEDAYVFERIAALHPKRLRWVFIETGMIRPGVGYGGDDNVRSLHWHDTARTWLALRALLSPADEPLRWKKALFGDEEERRSLDRAVAHIGLWFTRTVNAGRGATLLQERLAPPPRVHLSTVLGKGRDGYMPAGDGRPMPENERVDYERRIQEPSHISFLDRDAQHSLDDMLTRLSALGARPVLVVPPVLGKGRQYPQAGCPAPVFDYGDPGKWPGLFEVEHRADRGHVNVAGAEVLTRAVAADFIDLARRSAGSR